MAYSVGQAIIISIASKYLIIAIVILFGIFWIILHFYLRTSRQVRLLDIELKSPLYSQVMETTQGLTTIRAYGWEAQSEERLWQNLEHSQQALYDLYCLQRWFTLSVDIVIAILAVVLACVAITLRKKDGPGNLGVALVNLLGLSSSIRTILISYVTMEITMGAVARIRTFVSNLPLEDVAESTLSEPIEDWPTRGDIEFVNVSASYNASAKVLQDISLSIRHGQKIAICGRTGSGKSSLVLALFRMLDVEEGTIVVDGIDISHLKHESIRAGIIAVPQETLIFEGSVRQNVNPMGLDRSDEEISEVLARTKLSPVVERLGGLDANLTEDSLSYGQKQLLAISRAMLRRGKIIVLDEPTNGLDSEATKIVEEIIASWSDCTVIVIMHKLDFISNYDRIAVLDHGQLVQFDSPDGLMMHTDDTYRKIYNAGDYAPNIKR